MGNALIAAVLAVICLPACAPGVLMETAPPVVVVVRSVDELGVAVPWVTVGAAWTPYPPKSEGFPSVGAEDLKRLLNRNPAAWEYWNHFVRPVTYLQFRGLTSVSGTLQDGVDYGWGRLPWPPELTITYGAYRSGYEPAIATVKLKETDRGREVTLVLRALSNRRSDVPDYLRTLYEVRHELSDWRRNEGISRKNHERLEGLRARLIDAAGKAAAAGDRPAAAQIMYWAAYSPAVIIRDGKPAGFTQSNADSPRNCQALRQAAEYDPDNAHIQAQNLFVQMECAQAQARAGNINWADVERIRGELMRRAVELDRKAGKLLWPRFHDRLASDYGHYGMEEKSIEKFEWLRAYEPAWRSAEYYDVMTRNSESGVAK